MSLKSTLMALGIISLVPILGAHQASAEDSATAVQQQPVIVKVQPGDTLSSIAEANHTDYVRLFNANDSIANPDIIDVDQEIRIPKADEQLPDRFSPYTTSVQQVVAVTPAATQSPVMSAQSTPQATPTPAPAPRQAAVAQSSASNTYSYGWCTWYVKSRKPSIPNTWGNAYQWLGSAQASGYATGSTPVAGAIGASGGHVVYVESVSGNNVSISEMAYAGGIGVVHYRTVPASSFYYIYA